MLSCCFFFFFNDTATTEIYTLSLHDALPIRHSAAPSVSGIHPPVGTLVRLPATNALSATSIRPNRPAACHFGQFHCVAATNAPRMVVTTMVPTTAAPYAPPRASEEPKPTTKAMTAGNTSQFTIGT